MKKHCFLIGLSTALLLLTAVNYNCHAQKIKPPEPKLLGKSFDFTTFVDPFIGTAGNGHTFPGVTLPFGLVQLSPDTDTTGWHYCSGYRYEDNSIMGFSHTHLSGTGCADLGDILLMPLTGKLQTEPGDKNNTGTGYRSKFKKENETALVGYYSVYLDDCNVKAEMTATQRVGFHRYYFPRSDSSFIIIDLRHGIDKGNGYEQNLDSRITFEDDSTVSGYRISAGWAPVQYVYFVMKFSKPFKSSGFNWIGRNFTTIKDHTSRNVVGWVQFETKPTEKIMVKVALSTTSVEGARKNLEELPGWDFDGTVVKAKEAWNKILSTIEVSGSDDRKKVFYTALYHSCIAPNNIADIDGNYRGVDYNVRKSNNNEYYSTFSLWDTYRAVHPLYTLIMPDKAGSIINTMISHYEAQGFLPIWTLWGTENYCMIANHAIPVIVDGYLKGIGGFDPAKAYQAVRASSVKPHKKSAWELIDKFGYLPSDYEPESVSRTLEMCYNDWCVAAMAKAVGNKDDFNYFNKRSVSYIGLFDKGSGFFRAKDSKGDWEKYFDPLKAEYYISPYTEGNAWQYSWYVPQDVPGLIKLMGGNEKFCTKLDSLFRLSPEYSGSVEDMSGFIGQYVHGNEPSHHIAYLFNYAGKPWQTEKYIRQIADTMYKSTPDGLCGNEDCGQMSAWYVFSALGFYPVNPAGGVYAIGTPLVPGAVIKLKDGKKFKISAMGTDKNNCYIKSIKLNGKPYEKLYITHDMIMQGGTLEFVMDSKPNMNIGKWPALPSGE